MQFSIIATSFNDEKNIKVFLDNIEKQTVKPTSVIVVDGGSTDNTENEIMKIKKLYSFEIVTYFNLGRLNIAQGYNEAIKRCPYRWMVIAGIGNEYDTKFCECLIKKQVESGGRIIYTPIKGKEVNRFSRLFNIVFVGGRKGKVYPGASNRGTLINKSVYEQVGLHYENFVYAGEDAELFNRVKEFGIEMICCTETHLIWETPKNYGEYLKKSKDNAIADMQLYDKKRIVERILGLLLMFFLLIGIGFYDVKMILLAIFLAYVFISLKYKNASIGAFILKVHFMILRCYYYITQWNYCEREFHFNKNEIPRMIDGEY